MDLHGYSLVWQTARQESPNGRYGPARDAGLPGRRSLGTGDAWSAPDRRDGRSGTHFGSAKNRRQVPPAMAPAWVQHGRTGTERPPPTRFHTVDDAF